MFETSRLQSYELSINYGQKKSFILSFHLNILHKSPHFAPQKRRSASIEDGALKLAWDDREAELAYSKDNYKNILSAIDLLE